MFNLTQSIDNFIQNQMILKIIPVVGYWDLPNYLEVFRIRVCFIALVCVITAFPTRSKFFPITLLGR